MSSRHRMQRSFAVLIGLALPSTAVVAGAPGAAAEPAAHAAATTVKLKDSLFSPRAVTVRRGGQVRFVWAGSFPHNLIGRGVPASYETPRVRHKPLTVTFRRKGTFSFQCTIHPGMRMSVRVR